MAGIDHQSIQKEACSKAFVIRGSGDTGRLDAGPVWQAD